MSIVQDLTNHIDHSISAGDEEGVQLCVYHHGQCIVDITRGVRDDVGTPLNTHDMTLVWSVSKGITATCMHILAERRLIDYDDAVARFWPDFAKHGKSAISIRHIMSHTAGIPHLHAGVTFDDYADYERMCTIVADMVPISRAGQVPAYHGLTYGWPLAKVLEAVDGRSFGRFVQDEICWPLHINDLYIGIPNSQTANSVRLTHDLGEGVKADSAFGDPIGFANHPGIRATCMPAANMLASAHAIARVYAALIGDGVDGIRLLPPRRVEIATKVQRWAHDQTLANERGFGLGFFLGSSIPAFGLRDTTFGHDGFGGAIGFADPEYGVALALTKTRMNFRPDAPNLSADLAAIVRTHLNIPS
jgi:CubicO group peptidase (beta-lactamase class C family)